ncbi:MAG: ATP-binding protein, partial [Gemmatimonadota bacterium]
MRHEQRVLALAIFVGLPGSVVALVLLWMGGFSPRWQWTLTLLIVGGWLGSAAVLREWVVRPLQTLSNLLGALREGDFSIRARDARVDDALGLAMLEVNSLATTLREQRLGAVEASTLLRKVMEETTFRQEGMRHHLVVLSDLSRALREEERQAWKRLIRVLGHEINNSLAPIMSLAGSLQQLLARAPRAPDSDEDLRQGLGIISARAEALSRFMTSYARLARLPPPDMEPVDVGAWVHRIAELETRMPVAVHDGPDLVVQADGDQLDQLLINLVANAVDAALETGGGVEVSWHASNGALEVLVEDEGPGVDSPANLFVPFYTTKPNGTGIGLALSRQIAEAHG